MKKSLILLLFALLVSSNVLAQLPQPCLTPPCNPTGPGFPIDGGLGYLILAGVAYGYKKLRKKK